MSVCEVTSTMVFDAKLQPNPNGLLDLRMGVTEKGWKCTTCSSGREDVGDQMGCPGHFGHLRLAKPMFHVGFLTQMVKVLRCVDWYNSALLVDKVSTLRPPRLSVSGLSRSSTVGGDIHPGQRPA